MFVAAANQAQAEMLTPLTVEKYVVVKIAALKQQVQDMALSLHRRESGQLNENNPNIGAASVNAIYQQNKTNFMEHLRFANANEKKIASWLRHNQEQMLMIEQLQQEQVRLSMLLEHAALVSE